MPRNCRRGDCSFVVCVVIAGEAFAGRGCPRTGNNRGGRLDHLSEASVALEPLVDHLTHEDRRLRQALLSDEKTALCEAAVEPIAQQRLLMSDLQTTDKPIVNLIANLILNLILSLISTYP